MTTRGGTAARPKTARRGDLNREKVVALALAVLREEGLAAVSTRNLAARLGVKSTALYWHFRSKDELLDLVTEAIFAEIRPVRSAPYRKRLERIAREFRRTLLCYRDAAALIADRPARGQHRLRSTEEIVTTFIDAGFAEREAARLTIFFCNFLLGTIGEEAKEIERLRAGKPIRREAMVAALKGDPVGPEKLSALPHFANISGEQVFELGLGIVLDGIDGRRASLGPGRVRSRSSS